MKRLHAFDNLKAFLILCVIAGHLMEVCTAGKSGLPLYRVIYSFHMPVFMLISGFFGKFRIQKLLKLGGLYLVFQVAYHVFVQVILRHIPLGSLSISFTTPYWLLWYLLVMLYNTCLIPLLSRVKGSGQLAVLIGSVLLALLAGYCPRIGYYLSASRFFYFLPFFIGGFYLGQRKAAILAAVNRLSSWQKACILVLGILCMALAVHLCLSGGFTAKMLYGSYGYWKSYGPRQRLELYGIALLWIWAMLSLFLTFLNRPLGVFSWIGRNTLIFYLLHGFIIKAIAYL